jgi:predicted SprT family Zn-dependent metalloprotease
MTYYFDFTEEMYQNVLVHEMIHYYIAYNKIEDNEDHGVEFMKLAESLNRKYGLSITKKIDASSFKRNEKASKISWFFTKLFGC